MTDQIGLRKELTPEQQEQLERDQIDREPIGADEIILVGDLKYGVPVLRMYYDDILVWERTETALCLKLQPCLKFLEWSNWDVAAAMKTLREVQRIRELLRETPPEVVSAPEDDAMPY